MPRTAQRWGARLLLLLLLALPGRSGATTYYASPAGGGSGNSQSSPFQVHQFWSVSTAGDTLWLLDGTYTSDNLVPSGANGGPGSLITIKALNDGGPFFDGQFNQRAFGIFGSSYFDIEGVDAGNAGGNTEALALYPGTNHITIRRVCAFNASKPVQGGGSGDNIMTAIAWQAHDNLLEDLCLFGYGRNNWNELDDQTVNNTMRRAWIRWDGWPNGNGATCAGPAVQNQYHTFHNNSVYENLMLIYSGGLFDRSWPTPLCDGFAAGLFHRDGITDDATNFANLGNVYNGYISYGYATNNDLFAGGTSGGGFTERWVPLHATDLFVDARYGQSGTWATNFGCDFDTSQTDPSGSGYTPGHCTFQHIDRVTALINPGQVTSNFTNSPGATGGVTNAQECTSLGACPNFYTGTNPGTGARNCFEYQNSTLTNVPLWPWRMDDRIKQALSRSGIGPPLGGAAGTGYAANTVTSEIAQRYGAIPAACMRGGTVQPPTIQVTSIPLADINTSGKPLSSCWGGVGIDHNQNVYMAMGIGPPESGAGSNDVAIFKYNAVSGQRTYLDTLKHVTVLENNADPNETFAKVHVQLEEFNNKMYFSSHDFHDVSGGYHRGGHFFSYDPATNAFADLSKTDTGGVSAPSQGLIGMSIMKGQNKLIGFTYPNGDVVPYDLGTGHSQLWPAVAHSGGVSRHLFTADDNTAYITYDDPTPAPIYAMNVTNGTSTNSGFTLRTAEMPALTFSKNGNDVYILNWDYYYAFHRVTKTWELLGEAFPAADIGSGLTSSNVALGNDGNTLYTIAEGYPFGASTYAWRLYAFDLTTKQARLIEDISAQMVANVTSGPIGVIIGAAIDSQERIYTCGSEGYFIQVSNIPHTVAPTPLKSHWPFNEGSGTTATDILNNHKFSLQPGTGWSTPGEQGAAALRCTNNTTPVLADTTYDLPTYTWATWIKSDAAPSTANFNSPFANGPTNAGTDAWGLYWDNQATGGAQLQTIFHRDSNGNHTVQIPGAALQANTWYHLAATYDGTNLKTYLNGTLQTTLAVGRPVTPSGALQICGRNCCPAPWAGSLDALKIDDHAWTAAEVLADYAGARTGRTRHGRGIAE